MSAALSLALIVLFTMVGTDAVEHQEFDTRYIAHLLAVLNVYELGVEGISAAKPRWSGPEDDWRYRALSRSIDNLARRVFTAEHELEELRGPSSSNVMGSKKRRSNGGSSGSETGSQRPTADVVSVHAPSFFPPYALDSSEPVTTEDTDMLQINNQDDVTPQAHLPSRRRTVDMNIAMPVQYSSLDGDDRNPSIPRGSASAPPTGYGHHSLCPTCLRPATDAQTAQKLRHAAAGVGAPAYDPASPMLVPPGPLAAAAYESGMSAVDELRLLKDQIKDVAKVCSAVARGDLSKKVTVPVHGVVMVDLKDVINGMVDNLAKFSQEVTRVSVEVGTEGKLGGQAVVHNVAGTWYELTQVVNNMAAN